MKIQTSKSAALHFALCLSALWMAASAVQAGELTVKWSSQPATQLLPLVHRQPADTELLSPPHNVRNSAQWLGVASCTARACHGSLTRGGAHPGIFGNEQAVWYEQDKHGRAFAVLYEPRARRMAELMGLSEPAHRARECLACHAPAIESPHYTASMLSEGVSCEACHGSAEKWLVAHTSAHWNLFSPQAKERDYGLLNTKQLGSRAHLCAQCHIGGPGRDMNHDMIAAGHPRLTFEFATYLTRYPVHWYEKGVNDRHVTPTFEAKAWLLGQLAAAQAQMELLASRAEAAAADHPKAVWPEFSEYSCFSCHHDLQAKSWRQQGYANLAPGAKLGAPDWGGWNLAMLPTLKEHQAAAPAGIEAQLTDLRSIMADLGSNPANVAVEARLAAEQLSAWLTQAEQADYDQAWIEALMQDIARRGVDTIGNDWDRAAQVYLALCALQQSSIDARRAVQPDDRRIHQALLQMRGGLAYPGTREYRLDSPRDFDAALHVKNQLHAIERLLGR